MARTERDMKGSGLSVKRFFTKAGTHPYDEVEWEIRDAVIPNYKSGGNAFEQRAVEFPAPWSQNATNIVAQKYFRGPLGTPQRERSVRQLIDRVADTITGWGAKDGYFATEEDRDVFGLELKHLLVTQKAAFNSPVWFNVGVEKRPQCSACQPWHALVSTPQGFVPIGEIVDRNLVGLDVLDSTGTTRVVAVKNNGTKRVYRVLLRNGMFVEATGDHLVRAVEERRTSPEWRRVDEVRPGMRLHVRPHRSVAAEEPADESVVSEAALAGWLQADGFVGQYEHGTNRSLTIEFQTVNAEEEAWVKEHLDVIFPHVHRKVTDVARIPGFKRIRLYGEVLRPFVERNGLLGRRHEIRVPGWLWTAPRDAVRAYLRSVFQGDGFATVRGGTARVGFAVISERWTEDLQVLLLRLGVYSRRYRNLEKRDDRSDLWEIDIAYRSERRAFAEQVGFIGWDKQDRLESGLRLAGKTCPDLREEEVVRIEDLGEQPVYDIQTQSGHYLSNNVVVHNCFILAVDDTMSSILNWYVEEGTIFKGGSGSGINLSTIRSSREKLSSGGEASGPVSFMRGADASAGTIKSGGKCFRRGTLVGTPDGLRAVETLRAGDLVLTHVGPRRVNDFMPNGARQCYRVRTREGYEVEVTKGHRFSFWDEARGTYSVKPIEEFAPGDALYVLVEASEGGSGIALRVPEPTDSSRAATAYQMSFPSDLNEELAYVLGILFGDGDLRTSPPYRVAAAFAKDKAGLDSAERFRKYGMLLFGEEPLILGDYANYQVLGYSRKRLAEFLVANGIAKGKAESLGFPRALFTASAGVRAAFAAGVIDADGTYQRRGGWSISSIDRSFLVELQRLFLSLGVPSKLKLNRPPRGKWRALYRLSVVGHTFVDRFTKLIGVHSAKAAHNYVASDGADKGWGYRPSLVRPLLARVTRRGWKTVVERTVGTNETTGYGALARVAFVPDAEVSEYAHSLSRCVQVTLESVEPTEVDETYDIEVEEAHLLSANGLYVSNTRRAAKMIVLNADHPDVGQFIWCKAIEERKARVLRDAGFDMDLDGRDSASVQYQNANNSVRVTDDFMMAYIEDRDWALRAVMTGEVLEVVRARDLMRQIAQAAWECADPGMQYDTTINAWHTAPNTGRINASNPCCFVGETLVETSDGHTSFEMLHKMEVAGDDLPAARSFDGAAGTFVFRDIRRVWVAGKTSRLVELTTAEGATLRCTPEHRFLTVDGRFVEARNLSTGTGLQAVTADGTGTPMRVTGVKDVVLEDEVAVFDMEIDGTHNFAVTSEGRDHCAVIVHNSEYMHLDNSACNLASLNLMKFLDDDGSFDIAAFKHAVDIVFLAQEIVVGNSSYPTPKIEQNAYDYRELGLGYANLGALLMARGMAYDSDAGRAWAGAITALMTGWAYRASARFAEKVGPFAGYETNREPMLNVIRKHRAAVDQIDPDLVPEGLLQAAKTAWEEALSLGEQHGYRNSQASVLAPTGTIAFMLDCDTTGIEPDLALVKTKKLVGGGTMKIVNQTVPRALRRLGYSLDELDAILAYIHEHNTVEGSPHLKEEHYTIFDCAMGERPIHYMGHVKMMASVQPSISGAISKTVNVPESVTVEEVEQLLVEGWRLGLKSVAIYRDNCKVAQPLSADSKKKMAKADAAVIATGQPQRRRLPKSRPSHTTSFRVADAEGYINAGIYPDDGIGEIFLKVSKQGSTLSGIMDALAISISLGLQYGVPLEAYVSKFMNMRFEPSGMTDDPDIRFATSIVDYVFRRLALDHLDDKTRAQFGIFSTSERRDAVEEHAEPAAAPEQGVEITAAPAAREHDNAAVRLADAPLCFNCGMKMQPAGSCFVCNSCGSTSGCS